MVLAPGVHAPYPTKATMHRALSRRGLALAVSAALAIALLPATSASAAAPSTSCTSQSQSSLQRQLLSEVNAARKRAGKRPLQESSGLNKIAIAWSGKMAAAEEMSHNPKLRAQLPKGWRNFGENVAYGYTADRVTKAWLDSPGHRANILGDFNRIGIGVACSSQGWPYYTQDFGLDPSKTLTTSAAKVRGSRKVGATLTAQHGTWTSGTSFSYQWYRNSKAIEGATRKTLKLKTADRGDRFSVRITGKKSGYTTASRTSAYTSRVR
jgi:uncharacterized protein YkwD